MSENNPQYVWVIFDPETNHPVDVTTRIYELALLIDKAGFWNETRKRGVIELHVNNAGNISATTQNGEIFICEVRQFRIGEPIIIDAENQRILSAWQTNHQYNLELMRIDTP